MVAKAVDFQDILRDFRVAVGQDCMGWFCEKYGIGQFEFNAATSVDLILMVARWLREQERIANDFPSLLL